MNQVYRALPLLLMLAVSGPLFSQIETDRVYQFLNQPSGARAAALGSVSIATQDKDVNQAFANPALFTGDSLWPVSISHQFLMQGVGSGFISGGGFLKRFNLPIHFGIQYFNIGAIDTYNEYAEYMGSVNSNEFSFLIGSSYQLYENLRLGGNIKFVLSNLAEYTSSGLAIDLGAVYHVPDSRSTLGLAVRNSGLQLSTYAGVREPLPLDIQAMGSVRLEHLPLRLGIVAHHLHRWNLLYTNPYDVEQSFAIDDPFARAQPKQYGFVDNLFRHLILQAELSAGAKEGFRLRLAYNHFRKRDLSVNNFRSLAGFSGGLGINVSRFQFDYGLAVYHIAGSTHTLSLSTQLDRWKKKSL